MNVVSSAQVAPALRPGHVLRIADIDADGLDLLVDAVSEDLPVILDYRGPDQRSARQVVSEVLCALEDILVGLFPGWLPDSDAATLMDVADADERARHLCSTTGLPTSIIVELARAAAAGRRPPQRAALEVRADGLMRLLRHTYGRPDVVLAVRADSDLTALAQSAAATACEWLAEHGGLTVWLTADALPTVTRIPLIRLGGGHLPVGDSGAMKPEPAAPVLTVSRRPGSPAPHSIAEQSLERALSRQPWAHQRRWNRSPALDDPLAPTVIVDLLWMAQRLVVEVDGPDHRRPDKYTRDRIRDNMLQRSGHLVLRYTNEQVLESIDQVVDEIRLVLGQRTDPMTSPSTEEHPTWNTRN
ncbi:DUF559 domain-containing protein [Gordonia sp. NPDC003585]|uniref:endonuclease domain-containing protein n=1 Tax=Gordonia sp. NPDC003585 TaxID=3154275 RepID=UPI0033B62A3C